MSMRKLYQEKDRLQDELYYLHFAEPTPELYMQRRHELEYQIACVEEQIEFELKMRPFRVTLMIFVAIVIIGLVIRIIL